ncbi:MAG: sodium:solute symporter family protein, partial [Verrucomicrobiota bacterium]
YIIIGFSAGIVVSMIKRPAAAEKKDRLYKFLRTPVQPGEKLKEACTLPDGVDPGPRRVFFPNSNWEIPIPSLRDMIGFSVGWLFVIAIIAYVAIWIAV